MVNNVRILIYVESRYKVNRKRVKKAISDTLSSNLVTSAVEVSLAFVGDRKMKALNKKYRNLDKTTNVLSFPQQEIGHPDAIASIESGLQHDNITKLGDIVISYPQVIREAARDEVMVDDKIDELVKHSMLHLLGIHHE
jgi:probable rRNA maturation factor